MNSKDEEVRTNVAILVFAVIAGSAFLFTKQASATIPAATLTAFRLTIGSLGLIFSYVIFFGYQQLIVTFRYQLFGSWVSTKRVCLVGILNTVIPYTLYAVASEHGIDVSVQAILSGISPVFVAILSSYFIPDAEPLCRPLKLVGLVLCICGGCLVTLHNEIVDGTMSENSSIGVLAQLVAVACKSSAAIVAEHTFKYHAVNVPLLNETGNISRFESGAQKDSTSSNPTLKNSFLDFVDDDSVSDDEIATLGQLVSADHNRMESPGFAMGQACVGASVAIPLAVLWDFVLVPARGHPLCSSSDFDWKQVIIPILYLGLISSCFVYYLQFYIVKKAGGLRQIVTVDSLTPVVGVVEGALFNCDFCGVEQLSIILSICGASLCICGVSLFQYDAYKVVTMEERHSKPHRKMSTHKQEEEAHVKAYRVLGDGR